MDVNTIGLTTTIFFSLFTLCVFWNLIEGLKKKEASLLFLSLSALLPLLTLAITTYYEIRFGYWLHYSFVFPPVLLCVYNALVRLGVSKSFRIGLFLFFGLTSFFNYFQQFEEQTNYSLAQKKSDFLVKDPKVINVLFSKGHPFQIQVTKYYNQFSSDGKSIILESPLHSNALINLFNEIEAYNYVNFFFLDNTQEAADAKKVVDILGVNFRNIESSYFVISAAPHLYLESKPYKLKKMIFKRAGF